MATLGSVMAGSDVAYINGALGGQEMFTDRVPTAYYRC